MKRKKFRQLTRVGIGRPVVVATKDKRHDEAIYRCMIQNFAYEIQSEGQRDWYAFQLFKRAGDQDKLVARFHNHLVTLPRVRYGGYREHVFRVAFRLQRAGYFPKRLLLDVFRKINDPQANEVFGDRVLLRLGRRGKALFTQFMGEAIRHDELGNGFMWRYTSELPELRHRLRTVRYRGKQNKNTRAFFRWLDNDQPPQTGKQSFAGPFNSLANYLAYTETNQLTGTHRPFFNTLSDEDRLTVARLLTPDLPPERQYGLLAAFRDHPWPLSHDVLLAIAETTSHDRVMNRVADVLSSTKAANIRHFALAQMAAGRYPTEMFTLMNANLRPEDDELLLYLTRQSADQVELHEKIGVALRAATTHGAHLVIKSLRYLYHHSYCGVCRARAIKLLAEDGLLGHLAEEVRYDSYQASRGIR